MPKFYKHRALQKIFKKMRFHSTSPPSGNLVDGLPLDSHTNAVGIGFRLGRTRIYGESPKNVEPNDILHFEIQICIRQIQDLI